MRQDDLLHPPQYLRKLSERATSLSLPGFRSYIDVNLVCACRLWLSIKRRSSTNQTVVTQTSDSLRSQYGPLILWAASTTGETDSDRTNSSVYSRSPIRFVGDSLEGEAPGQLYLTWRVYGGCTYAAGLIRQYAIASTGISQPLDIESIERIHIDTQKYLAGDWKHLEQRNISIEVHGTGNHLVGEGITSPWRRTVADR
jgi:hypothetical protein